VTNLFLFFHLLGAFCFFAGGAVVGVLQLAAIRQERPSQVHAFLRLAPFGAALVGTGALLTLGFGIGLAEHEGLGFSPAWIQAALGLWVAAMVLGAFGGRTARHARRLAAKLAAEGDAPSPELRAMVGARGPLYASYASFVLLLAIVVLMVWQPGGAAQATPGDAASAAVLLPKTVEKQILRATPQSAYGPTRLPGDVEYFYYEPSDGNRGFRVAFKGADGLERISFSVYPVRNQHQCQMPPNGLTTGVLTANGYQIGWEWEQDSGVESAWRCIGHGKSSITLQADAMQLGVDRADLVTFVAYAAPFGP